MVIARFCAIASLFFWKMSLFPAFNRVGKLRIASAAEAAIVSSASAAEAIRYRLC